MSFAKRPGRFQPLPLDFNANETIERGEETRLDGKFIFMPPKPGFIQILQAARMTLPVNLYGTQAVPYSTQLQYPPANFGRDYSQLEPLVIDDSKYRQRILRVS